MKFYPQKVQSPNLSKIPKASPKLQWGSSEVTTDGRASPPNSGKRRADERESEVVEEKAKIGENITHCDREVKE